MNQKDIRLFGWVICIVNSITIIYCLNIDKMPPSLAGYMVGFMVVHNVFLIKSKPIETNDKH